LEWSKVKNIIILILLMVNGFLLVLVLGQQRAVSQYAHSAVTQAAEVLERNGITVAPEALSKSSPLPTLTAPRDLQAEQRISQVLLGEAARTDRGGGLYAYENRAGTALFRASGEFQVQLAGLPLEGRAPADHAENLLKDMGLHGELVSVPAEGRDGEVVFLQTLDGAPVYSCRLVFQYAGGYLQSISGTLLTGTPQPVQENTEYLDLPNALIRFLDGILDRGGVCSAVTGLRPGYRLTQSFGTDLRLAPTWLVTTNAGSYYMDGVTGALETA